MVLVALVGGLAIYTGTFSFWWLRSPARLEMFQGRRVHIVEFQFNSVSWRTESVWVPAFWFMEHVYGYEPDGFVAMGDDSVLTYSKFLP